MTEDLRPIFGKGGVTSDPAALKRRVLRCLDKKGEGDIVSLTSIQDLNAFNLVVTKENCSDQIKKAIKMAGKMGVMIKITPGKSYQQLVLL